jgi:hypothetical protein
MSVYDRDPSLPFSPPARNTRSQKSGPLYSFNDAENRKFLKEKKEKNEQERREVENKLRDLKKRLSQSKFKTAQKHRQLPDLPVAEMTDPPPPPHPHASDLTFIPGAYTGRGQQDESVNWFVYFEKYCDFKGFTDAQKLSFAKLLMRDAAQDHLSGLDAGDYDTYAKWREIFKQRWISSEILKWRVTNEIFSTRQGTEPVDEFVTKIRKKAKTIPLTDDVVRYALMKNFRPAIRNKVIGAKTLDELQELARAAEIVEEDQPVGLDKLNEEMRAHHKKLEDDIKKLTEKMASTSVSAIGGDESEDETGASGRSRPKHVSFDKDSDRSRSATPTRYSDKPKSSFRNQSPARGQERQDYGRRDERQGRYSRPSYDQPRQWTDRRQDERPRQAGPQWSQWQGQETRYQNDWRGQPARGRQTGYYEPRGAPAGPERGRRPLGPCWTCGGEHLARFCTAVGRPRGQNTGGPQ